jgi:hypothetical protein
VRNGARWSIAAVILMIAGVVAIWPRSEPAPAPPRDNVTQAAPDLKQARAEAGLSACPEGAQGPADLRGITAECLADGRRLDVATALDGPVLVESRPADALELLTALKVTLPGLLDEDGRTRRKLHPVGLPASYLVRDGKITLIENPRVFESVDQVMQAVAHG